MLGGLWGHGVMGCGNFSLIFVWWVGRVGGINLVMVLEISDFSLLLMLGFFEVFFFFFF